MKLEDYGWDAARDAELRALGGLLEPARVAVEHRGSYDLVTRTGELRARPSGRMRRDAESRLDLPAIGDFVGVSGDLVQHLFRRRSRVVRTAFRGQAQVMAANVDVVFVVTTPTQELNPQRLQRYLATVRGGGAEPVLVLNKLDLCDDPTPYLDAAASVAGGAPVHVTSAVDGRGVRELEELIGRGRTGALIGSSGVGKSTLLNALLGSDVQAVAAVRERDERGRHATARRELFRLPGGALLIDSPGMREIQVFERADGLHFAFPDIGELAAGCRFGDCTHREEPGCRVRAGVADGTLPAARLASYRRLYGELRRLEREEIAGSRWREKE